MQLKSDKYGEVFVNFVGSPTQNTVGNEKHPLFPKTFRLKLTYGVDTFTIYDSKRDWSSESDFVFYMKTREESFYSSPEERESISLMSRFLGENGSYERALVDAWPHLTVKEKKESLTSSDKSWVIRANDKAWKFIQEYPQFTRIVTVMVELYLKKDGPLYMNYQNTMKRISSTILKLEKLCKKTNPDNIAYLLERMYTLYGDDRKDKTPVGESQIFSKTVNYLFSIINKDPHIADLDVTTLVLMNPRYSKTSPIVVREMPVDIKQENVE